MNDYIKNKQTDFDSVVDFFKKELISMRTGRANASILDAVQVEAYGVASPLNAVASINILDGQNITITPWDKGVMKDVEKAIVAADLGVSVVNDGERVRITVPKMTEENRREIVKKLNEKHEEARIKVRKVRDDIKSAIERDEKDKEISEDDKFAFIKELDTEVAKFNNSLKEIRDKKEKEIMTI